MKILITDDHSIVREGLKRILSELPGVETIDEASSGDEALAKTGRNRYDLVLLDISLPDKNGLEILKRIAGSNNPPNVLMLSMHAEEQYAIRALRLGASGYLTKDTASEELIAAVRLVAAGGKYISPSIAKSIENYLDPNQTGPLHQSLSQREFEVFIRLAAGKALKDIGDELCVSEKTVSTYRSRLLEKMGMKKNAEITQYCIINGLL